jgi:hypothetical protein
MTSEFAFFACVVLMLRLRLMLADAAVGWPSWGAKTIIELAALALFQPHRWLFALGAACVVLNLIAALWERRTGERSGGRLLFGVLQLAIVSLCLSPSSGVHFRPEVATVGGWLESWSALGEDLRRLVTPAGLRMALGLLLTANEANLLVRWLFGRLQIKPGSPSLMGQAIDASEFNRGRIIGLLERVLIYAFVLTGQYGAIGFTLAAKGFTRFKELENRGFAEYVLIGTLLSSGIAMAIGAWVKVGW